MTFTKNRFHKTLTLLLCVGFGLQIGAISSYAQTSKPAATKPATKVVLKPAATKPAATKVVLKPAATKPATTKAATKPNPRKTAAIGDHGKWLQLTYSCSSKTGTVDCDRIAQILRRRLIARGLETSTAFTLQPKKIFVCLSEKDLKNPSFILRKLKQELPLKGGMSFLLAEESPRVTALFLRMKASVASGIAVRTGSYSRPDGASGVDQYFEATSKKVLVTWLQKWNGMLKQNKSDLSIYILKSAGTSKVVWRSIFLNEKVYLTEKAVRSVDAAINKLGFPEVGISMSPKGAATFAKLTKENIGRRLAIVSNGEVLIAPVIQVEIKGGNIRVSLGAVGDRADREKAAKLLAGRIFSNTMSAELGLLTEGVLSAKSAEAARCARYAVVRKQMDSLKNLRARLKKLRAKVPSSSLPAKNKKVLASGNGLCKSYAFKVNGWCYPNALFRFIVGNSLRRYPAAYRRFLQGRVISSMKRRIIQGLLLSQAGVAAGHKASPAEIDSVIHRDRSFQEKGKFSQKRFLKVIANYGVGEAGFRTIISRILLRKKYLQAWKKRIVISKEAVKKEFIQKNTQRSLFYLRFDPSKYSSTWEPSLPEVEAFVLKNKKNLQAVYSRNIRKYSGANKVHARHILIKLSGKATKAQGAKALQKINMVRALALKKPSMFPALAKKFSEGPSKRQGGSLGFFAKGQMVPPFSKAAFALKKPNDISAVVKTRFGYHIIQLVAIQKAKNISFDQVKVKLAKSTLLKKHKQESIKKLIALAFTRSEKVGTIQAFFALLKQCKAPIALTSPVQNQMELHQLYSMLSAKEVKSTDMFHGKTQKFSKVGRSRTLAADAFKLAPKKLFLSKVYEIQGKYYLFALKEKKAPVMKSLPSQAAELKIDLGRKVFMKEVPALLKKLEAKAKIIDRIPSRGRRRRPSLGKRGGHGHRH